jgi:hypothetical protein
MECLLSGFMVRDGLLCFVPPKSFSLSGRQTEISAFLVVDHFPFAVGLNPEDVSFAFSWRGAC